MNEKEISQSQLIKLKENLLDDRFSESEDIEVAGKFDIYDKLEKEEYEFKDWEKYLKLFKKKCYHTGEKNIFNLIPISCDNITTEKINTLIKEKNIKAWCILNLSCLLRLDIDKLIPLNYYFEPIEDFSVPSFKEMNNIIEFLHENSKKGNILVTCMAGHGRTGMVLSIWAGLNGIENPISYIRKEYCDSAVETVTQEMFVNLYLKYIKNLK